MLTLHKLKIAISHSWHTLWMTVLALFAFAIVLLGITRALTPLAAQQKPAVEHWVSIILQHPVKINSLKIRWHNFQPIIKLTDVVVLNKSSSHPLLSATELDIGFNILKSLLNNKLQLGSLTISGINLKLQQSEDQLFSFPTELLTTNDSNFNELLAWLFSVPKIALKNITVSWHTHYHSVLPISGINLVLRNQGQQHKLQGQAQVAQTTLSQLAFVIEIDGDWQKREQLKAQWYLQADNIILTQWLTKQMLAGIDFQRGLLDAKLWGSWQNNHLKTVRSSLSLHNIKIIKDGQAGYIPQCNANLYWQPQPNDSWSLDAQLNNVTSSYWNKIPGVRNLHAFIHLTPTAGNLTLPLQPLQIDFGPLFRSVIKLDQISGQAKWQQQNNNWLVEVTDARVKNSDGNAKGTLNLLIPKDNSSPTIDLHATGHINSAQHIANYLPLTVLKPALVQWLERAIVKATGGDTIFTLAGRLKDFPFDKDNGIFLISTEARGVDIDYWPGWPLIKNMALKLVFAGRRMDADIHSAQLLNTPLHNIQVSIPMLRKDVMAMLTITGNVAGNLVDGIQFLHDSPLQGKLLDVIKQWQAKGPMQLQLQLAIPLESTPIPAQVKGQLIIHGSTLTLPPGETTLQNLQGQLNFTQADITAHELTATLGNKPLKINIATNKPTLLQLFYGDLTARLTAQAPNNGWMLALASPTIQGQIQIPADKKSIQANFQRLYLEKNITQSTQNWSPSNIPQLTLNSDDFRYGEKHFGHLFLQLSPLADGVKIENLQATSSAYNFSAKGTWRRLKEQDQTQIAGTLTSPNINAALNSWGLPADISAQQSNIQFDLKWPDAIYNPSFQQSSGQIKLDLSHGQIADISASTKMKADIGRLLTFLSLQSLERRVQLDFSDFKAKGFNFDTLKGNLMLQNGNATTNNMQLNSSVAQIDINGRIGLVTEDYDLRFKVVPNVTTSLPVIVGLAGGPIAGLATWAASKVLNPAVNMVTTDYYRMTGPWNAPKIEKMGANR